jgi:large subunit ribosomal protein L4
VSQLQGLGLGDGSVLVVIAETDERIERAARNLPWADAIRAGGLNVYDVLRHSQLLLTRGALDAVQQRLGARGGADS